MNARARFFDELHRAITRGFTLAAVSVSVSCTKPALPERDAGARQPAARRLRDPDGGLLARVPAGALACTGEETPEMGPCCTNVHCYPPSGETCAAPGDIREHREHIQPRLAPGSGTCMCGQTQGPFVQPDGGGECCYVVGTMGCAGRPLREGGGAVVAAVVVRTDWA